MNDWQIVLLHTRRSTLLKRAIETAFPGRAVSLHVPALSRGYGRGVWCSHEEVLSYFRRYVHDSGIWRNRVLTIYGDGDLHHYTYALSRLAAERRSLEGPELSWTYFHVDNHRDDWGDRSEDGTTDYLNCANFVDSLCHHHGAVPFMIGPEVYPAKDSRGYRMQGTEIPIYSNGFPQSLQRSRAWRTYKSPECASEGTGLPVVDDLRTSPTPAYLSFDLDVLGRNEIVTNFGQNDYMTVQRLHRILDRIRPHKRVFSADILGFPDDCHHPLSALTVVLLARKVLGMGTKKLLGYHGWLKQKQAGLVSSGKVNLDKRNRASPIEEGELLEVLRNE